MVVLGDAGPEAIRVETLAADLRVTKGGFYGHFADRNELLDSVLDEWETASTDAVFAQVERRQAVASDRLLLAGALTFSKELLPIDLAVRSWARRDTDVAQRLRRVDNRRMDYLREQLASVCAGGGS